MALFLHTADWQIGKPYLRVPDPTNRFRLQQERLEAIRRIADVARTRQAAFVLVAGDLFDSTTVPPRVVLEVLEAIGAMELPVMVIPGNHDHGGSGSLWHRDDFRREHSRRAPNLHLLLKREPVELETALLLPCPLLRREDSNDPTGWIAALDWSLLPSQKPRIVLAHGGVQAFMGRDYEADEEAQSGASNLLDLSGLNQGEIDYIALGDWHNLKQVSERAWYPGTPEPDGFDRGQDNQRAQVLLVEASRGELPRVEMVPTGRILWHNIAFRFGGDDDLERFERQLEELLGGRVCRDLLRLEVSGSLSLAGHRRYERLITDLEHQLLRLRLKGSCEQEPRAEELEALTDRPGDPLIAAVAARLQRRLTQLEAATDPDAPESATVTRLALCELFRLATSA